MSSVRLVETKQEEKERKKEEKDYAPARQCKHPERQKKKASRNSSPLPSSLSLFLFIFSFSDFLSLSIPSVCIAHNDLSVKLDRIVDDSAVKYLEKNDAKTPTGYP